MRKQHAFFVVGILLSASAAFAQQPATGSQQPMQMPSGQMEPMDCEAMMQKMQSSSKSMDDRPQPLIDEMMGGGMGGMMGGRPTPAAGDAEMLATIEYRGRAERKWTVAEHLGSAPAALPAGSLPPRTFLTRAISAVAFRGGASAPATVAKPCTDTDDEHAEKPADNHYFA